MLCRCAGQPSGPDYVKNGKEFGKVRGAFRHRWWNYYQRGMSFAEGQFYAEAVTDFREAITQRAKDQRMARTYGMHFVDYFPHRELGIVCYEMGDLEAAKRQLELSLGYFPSAKAYFYLDQVRKALIERTGISVLPPQLTLALTADEVWTKDDPVVLSGVVEDEHYVAGITIGDMPLFLKYSQKRISFKKPLDLSQGMHAIEVVATNLLDKATKRKMLIHVDREGPIVTLEKPHFDGVASGGDAGISGWIYDEAGVYELRINGRPVAIKEGVESLFNTQISAGADRFQLIARDRLGNETIALISLKTLSVGHDPVLLASADPDPQNAFLAGLFGPKDTQPPTITLKGWGDKQTVFLNKVYIEGQASDESGVEDLTINDISVLRHKGSHIFFGHMAELEEGENMLTVEATDRAGNKASKHITIIRRIPKAFQLAERLSLTTFPFEERGSISETSLAFQDNLIDALVNRNRFRVVERKNLDIILKEQKLSRTNLFDRRTALKLGKLAAAQSVITGSIIEDRTGIEVVARMIDAETSEILATEDVYDERKDIPALRALAEGMAVKFHREFPLVDGFIIRQQGKNILTDLGQGIIRLRSRLIVFREEPIKHPVTGKALGADNVIIAHARVTQVMPRMSKAELSDGQAKAIQRLDKVITQ